MLNFEVVAGEVFGQKCNLLIFQNQKKIISFLSADIQKKEGEGGRGKNSLMFLLITNGHIFSFG